MLVRPYYYSKVIPNTALESVREATEPVCRQLAPNSEHVRQRRLEHGRWQHQIAVEGAREPALPGGGVARIVGRGGVVEDPPLHGEEVLKVRARVRVRIRVRVRVRVRAHVSPGRRRTGSRPCARAAPGLGLGLG